MEASYTSEKALMPLMATDFDRILAHPKWNLHFAVGETDRFLLILRFQYLRTDSHRWLHKGFLLIFLILNLLFWYTENELGNCCEYSFKILDIT